MDRPRAFFKTDLILYIVNCIFCSTAVPSNIDLGGIVIVDLILWAGIS